MLFGTEAMGSKPLKRWVFVLTKILPKRLNVVLRNFPTARPTEWMSRCSFRFLIRAPFE